MNKNFEEINLYNINSDKKIENEFGFYCDGFDLKKNASGFKNIIYEEDPYRNYFGLYLNYLGNYFGKKEDLKKAFSLSNCSYFGRKPNISENLEDKYSDFMYKKSIGREILIYPFVRAFYNDKELIYINNREKLIDFYTTYDENLEKKLKSIIEKKDNLKPFSFFYKTKDNFEIPLLYVENIYLVNESDFAKKFSYDSKEIKEEFVGSLFY